MRQALEEMYPIVEEVELDEAKYELYHKDFSSAMQHAYHVAKKHHGITIDPKEIDDKVATGPSKPSEGKTNKYRLKGDKGAVQIQVYNKGGSKPFELNMYKEEVDLDEGTKQVLAHGGKGQYKAVRDGDITKIMYKGKVVGTADFDSGADSFFASIKGEKGQKSFDDAQAMVDYFAKKKITEEVDLDEKPADFIRLSFISPADVKEAKKWMDQNLPGANQGFTGMDASGKDIEFEGVDDAEDLMAKLKKAGFKFKMDYREEVELDEEMSPEEIKTDAEKAMTQFNSDMTKNFPDSKYTVKAVTAPMGGGITFVFAVIPKAKAKGVDLLNAPAHSKYMMHLTDNKGKAVPMSKFSIAQIMGNTFPVKWRKITGKSPTDAVKKMVDWFKKNKDGFETLVVEEVELDEAAPMTTSKQDATTQRIKKRMKDKKEEDELDEYGGNFGGGPMRVSYGKKKKDKKEEVDEASARADAMKAMRKGKSVDPADVDNVASDEDIKAASKNIIMQLRKAVSLRSYEVEFADGKHKVDQKIAQAVQNKYNTMRRPADKEKYQMQIAKSYKDMLQSLKAGYGEQKESVLNRIGRKIKEKNNG